MARDSFDEGLTSDDRKSILSTLTAAIANDKENAYSDEINMQEMISLGQQYYDCEQALPENNYGYFRDTRNLRNIETFAPLLSITEPRYTFVGGKIADENLSSVFRDYDDKKWHDLQMRHKVSMAIKEMLKSGTSVLADSIIKKTGTYDLDCSVHSISEFLVGDWTEYETNKQPRITQISFVPINDFFEEYPELRGKVAPGEIGTDILNSLKEIWQNIVQLSGSKGIKFQNVVDEKAIDEQWYGGNIICLNHWWREKGKYHRAVIANNVLASKKKMPHEQYPFYFLRYLPQAKHFLGTPMYKIDRHYSDAKTEAMHAILYHAAAFGRGFWLVPDNADNDPSELQTLFNNPGSVILYPPQLRGQIDLKMPSPMPQAQTEIFAMCDREADMTSGNLPWISGAITPGQDPAQKSALFNQAGMNRLKQQAQYIDDELLLMGKFRLWFYKNFTPPSTIIRCVGDTNPNGQPRFINVNYVIQMETFKKLEELVDQNKGYQFDKTVLRPESLKAQVNQIRAQVIPQLLEAEKQGGPIPDIRLNDFSLYDGDVSVRSAETNQYNELRKAQYMIPLAEMKLLHPWEVRKQGGYSIAPDAMKGLLATTPMTPIEQFSTALNESAGNPQQLGEVIKGMLQEIQTLQQALQMQ